MSLVTEPVILDRTGQIIADKLQGVIDAINGGTIDPLTVTRNGTYTPSGTTLGYGPVTVDVPSGGVALLTKAEWNALTTEQKRTYGLVAIEDTLTGYTRGVLVNGADYSTILEYLPETNERFVKTFAIYNNFIASTTEWGEGGTPITASKPLARYMSEDAVYFDAKLNRNSIGIPLGGITTDFTIYVVAKGLQYASGDVVVMGSVYSWSSLNEIMLYHRSGDIWRSSVYGSDQDLIDTQGRYVAVAIRSDHMAASWFAHDESQRVGVQYNRHGESFTFGSYETTFSTDLAVKFVGYVNVAETDSQIRANLVNLAEIFDLSDEP